MNENEIKKMYDEHVSRTGNKPDTANCRVVWNDGQVYESVNISLFSEDRKDDESIFFYCNDFDDFLRYTGENTVGEDWRIDEVLCFDTVYPKEEERSIWLRLGAIVYGTKEEIDKVINGDAETLKKLLDKKQIEFSGDTYIPEECIEEYNEEFDTDYEPNTVEFDL